MKIKYFNFYCLLSAIVLLSQTSLFAAGQTGLGPTQCIAKVDRIENEFQRALDKSVPTEITTHLTCKLNPCSGTNEVVQVTSLSSTDWHNSGTWAFKEAQRYNFGDDTFYVDTTTGYGALRCGDNEAVSYSNWRQWINSGTFTVNNNTQCNFGVDVDFIAFCGDTFDVGTEHYCTYQYFYDGSLTLGSTCGDQLEDPLLDNPFPPADDDHSHFIELETRYNVEQNP